MRNESPRNDRPATGLFARLDNAAGKMNAFLLVLAIGLAALDFTCFWVFQVRDALPSVTRISANPAVAAKPAVAGSKSNTLAAVSRTRPGDTMTGF